MGSRFLGFLLAGTLMVSLASVCGAEQEEDSGWRFELTAYAWITWGTTDSAVGPVDVSLDVSPSDLLEVLDYAGFVHFEAQKNRYGAFCDLTYASLSEEVNLELSTVPCLPGIKVDGNLKFTMIDLGGFYRFGDDDRAFDVLAGGRYTRFEVDLDLQHLSLDRDRDWLDPFVGGRFQTRLSDRWRFFLRSDIGGFGVGSELMWNVITGFRYGITENADIGFAFRYLDVDYEEDSVKYDTQIYGPLVGLTYRF